MDDLDPGATAVRTVDPGGRGPHRAAASAGCDRERALAVESERIAEVGLRRLWEAKNELDRRVEERTAQLRAAQQRAQAGFGRQDRVPGQPEPRGAHPLQTILSALELAEPSDPADRSRQLEAVARRG